jgi:hypothetical protein
VISRELIKFFAGFQSRLRNPYAFGRVTTRHQPEIGLVSTFSLLPSSEGLPLVNFEPRTLALRMRRGCDG